MSKLPVLDPGFVWHWDPAQAKYVSDSVSTLSTKKTTKHIVVVPATDKFPAQVATDTADVPVGNWKVNLVSGAIPQTKRDELLVRVDILKTAVTAARETANSVDAPDIGIGAQVSSYLFNYTP